MNLCDYKEIRALLARHGFHFSKSMGQNFLIDPDIPCAIAAASGADMSCGVLEIGPGIGSLTTELSRLAGKVVTIELDRTLMPVLTETLSARQNVTLIHGDALKLDLAALADEHFQDLTPIVCANLPYNITSPVLEKLVQTPCFQSFTVLVQREVAQRIAAVPGGPTCSSFSFFMQYYMETKVLFDVPPDRFFPAPKVTSSVLQCIRRPKPAVETEDENFFFRVIRGGFLLRRKTLVNSLSAALPMYSRSEIADAIASLGLPPSVRGERLTLQNYADLTKILDALDRGI